MDLYDALCPYDNLFLAYKKARKHKTTKSYIMNFEMNLKENLLLLRSELLLHCYIIEPIFEKSFIYDSYANRIGKGTLKALQRFDFFKKKASRNNKEKCYFLKADIQKYFERVYHKIFLSIIKKRISDKRKLEFYKDVINIFTKM